MNNSKLTYPLVDDFPIKTRKPENQKTQVRHTSNQKLTKTKSQHHHDLKMQLVHTPNQKLTKTSHNTITI